MEPWFEVITDGTGTATKKALHLTIFTRTRTAAPPQRTKTAATFNFKQRTARTKINAKQRHKKGFTTTTTLSRFIYKSKTVENILLLQLAVQFHGYIKIDDYTVTILKCPSIILFQGFFSYVYCFLNFNFIKINLLFSHDITLSNVESFKRIFSSG